MSRLWREGRGFWSSHAWFADGASLPGFTSSFSGTPKELSQIELTVVNVVAPGHHTVNMRFRWLVIPGLVLAGCGANNGPITRAAGSWPGEFSIDTVDHHSDPKAIEREVMKGNLELYVTGRKFELNMTARHQGFTVLGTWSAERTGRVTMVANKYSFDNPTDEDQKALGLRIIQPDEI